MRRDSGFGLEVSQGFAAKIILAVVGFAGSIVFARVLGPVGYGAFYTVLVVANVVDKPITGFGTACKKRISEYDLDPGEILGAGLAVAGAGILVTAVAITIASRYFDVFEIDNGSVFVAILFTGLVLFKVLQPMVAGVGKFGTSIVLDMIRSLLTIPLQILLVVGFGLGVSGMVFGLTIASLLTVPLELYVLGARPAVPSAVTIRSLWSYAKFSIPNNFVGTAYSRLDILLLSAVLGSGAAGQYQIAMQLVLPGILLSSVMGSGLFAEVSTQVSQNKAVDRQITNNVAFASLFAIPIVFGALAMPESIVVTVFGGQYREAATLMIGLGFFQILRTQVSQISSVLSGFDRPDLNLWIKTVTMVTNIILGVALVYRIGLIGVVIATIVAEATNYVLLTYYARRHVAYDILPAPLRYQVLAAGIMFVVVELLHQIFGIGSWFDLLSIVGIGAAVYGAALVTMSDIFMLTARHILNDAKNRDLGK